jgi:signal transduction histidine kinase
VLSIGLVVAAGLAWLGLLFFAGVYGERHPRAFAAHWRHVYALSLAVHCTSWTFYGTVTQAARNGWALPPTFVGAIVLYVLGAAFMVKLVKLSRETNATSIADLIATRLGKDAWLAATVTLVAALGLIPYIALQLKAMAMSFAMLTARGSGLAPAWQDSALYVALAMALFAMLFGTRRVSAAEHNRGLVLAMAFESLLKLAAMLALGAFVWFGLDLSNATPLAPPPPMPVASGFAPLMLLGAFAMFVMPHQFHIAVVECREQDDVRTARWQFPLYLILIALPVLPLARAGEALLGNSVPSDLYVLALPLSQGQEGLALFAFLGGLSAATGMVVVSTLTLSLMIGNHWFAPGLLRGAWSRSRGQGGDLRGHVLALRRIGIVAIMLLAWGYSRLVAGSEALADVGAVSFSALATLVPALAFAVWRPQTPPRAVVVGILAAFTVWCWVQLVPAWFALRGVSSDVLVHGPFGLEILSPNGLFGLTGWSRLGRAVGASLFVGLVATFLASAWQRELPRRARRGLDARTLRDAGLRFLPRERLEDLLRDAPAVGAVPAQTEARIERELAAVLGSASARVLLDAARREAGHLDTVAAIVGEASRDLRFNQRVLETSLENMSQGISVVDAQLRLVAWNRRYAELFGFPESLLQVGRPIAELARYALQQMPPKGDGERALQRRLAHMRAGTPHLTERVFPDGSIVEIRGNPMPGGGFVATFTDVTAFRQTEAALLQSNETLEQRVEDRTAALESARREAERANDAKSRFLAAIGHDLLQPLHAAHLFTDALAQQVPQDGRDSVRQIRGALDSTTDLLTALLDMSRLEAGGLDPQPREFALAEVLEPLASEFRVLAAERGLDFAYSPTRAWVRSDPQLLRRVLQNFLANAVRYTPSGRIVLGVRRAGDTLRIEVHDTGPGIDADTQAHLFDEFRRGTDAAGQGLGLGLAIADRIARLLESPLTMRSTPGIGTVFAVDVPRVATPRDTATLSTQRNGLAGTRVLVLDNEVLARDALRQLLEGMGCHVVDAGDAHTAHEKLCESPADLWLFDYHLDDGATGVNAHERLAEAHGARPTVILSADAGAEVRAAVHEAGLPLLMKPLKPLALKSVLDRLLAARAVT